MLLRLALLLGLAAAIFAAGAPQPSWAQNPAQESAPPAATTPQAAPAAPATHAESNDAFGAETDLIAKSIVYVKGTGTWEDTFETITAALKKLKTYTDKEGLKADGPAITIFTSADDKGFDYEVAVPTDAPPKNPPHGEIAVGTSPQGRALKFVYRGSYDELELFYETVTNYLDDHRIDLPNSYIEEYPTDLLSTDPDKLVVNVLIPIK
jgi:effector-binding domain-containing protein